MTEQMGKPFDLLLGRKTFEIFASYWPDHQTEGAGINKATKYVVSKTLNESDWDTSVFLGGDSIEKIRQLKQGEGPDLQVYGSINLVQALLKHELVDELWLKIFPVTLGTGKRLFEHGTMPTAYALLDCTSSPSGVIIASFRRAGEVQSGSF